MNHPPSGCPRSKDYLTKEEEAPLAQLRALKAASRACKARLAAAEGQERPLIEAELERLRSLWRQAREEYARANRRKLIMLGHLPPDDQS